MWAIIFGLVALACLVVAVGMGFAGEFMKDYPAEDTRPAGKRLWPFGIALELGGWLIGFGAALVLTLLVLDLADFAYLKSFVRNSSASTVSTPTRFDVNPSTGEAMWSLPNPHTVLWVALTVEPESGERFTIVLKPWQMEDKGENLFSYKSDSIKNCRSASFWYGTDVGPSPLVKFPAGTLTASPAPAI